MITENLSTLKIHKLTQAQYERELEAGRIDKNALYLTPEEEITASDIGALGNYGDQTLTDGSLNIVDTNNAGRNFGMTRTIDSVDYKLLMQPTADTANFYYYRGNTLANAMQLYPDRTSFRKPVAVTAGGTGAITAEGARTNLGIGTNKVFNKLTDIGITTFPTTMKTIANSMPNNSTLMLDSRDIVSGGVNEISDLGSANAGMYMFMRGNSNARLSLLHIYGATSATTSYINYGCYAATSNKVVWILGEKQGTNYKDCRYRTAVDGNTEWINPPMVAGVEYRTTERWNGKPVYRKLLVFKNTTAWTGEGRYEISHGITNLDSSSLKIDWTTDEWTLPHVSTLEALYISGLNYQVSDGSKLVIKTTGNANWDSGRTFYFDMKYCKTV